MSNNGMEFTPEQVEHQIDMLAQSQEPWPGPSSEAHLVSYLYQIYTENNAIVENAWQSRQKSMIIDQMQGIPRFNTAHVWIYAISG